MKLSDAVKIYKGTGSASKVYKGASQVWSAAPVGSWHTVFTQTLTAESGGWGDFTFAPVIPAGALSHGGSKIRVTFQASPTEGATIAVASIVERDGITADGITPPTQLFFSSSPTVVIPMASEVTSDEAVFTTDITKDYLIRVEVPNTYSADNFGAMAVGAYSGSYYRFGDYGTSQIMEPATLYNQFYAVNKIEVFY